MAQVALLIVSLLVCLYGAFLFIKSKRRITIVQTLPDVIWMQRLYFVKEALGDTSVDEIMQIMGTDNYSEISKKKNITQDQLKRLGLSLEDAIALRMAVPDTEVITSLYLGYTLVIASSAVSIAIFGIQVLS